MRSMERDLEAKAKDCDAESSELLGHARLAIRLLLEASDEKLETMDRSFRLFEAETRIGKIMKVLSGDEKITKQ